MIVADGRLFVVQEDGKLMCFGAEKPHSVQKHQLAKTSLAKSENPDEIGRRAERVLAAVKQDGGYALVVGLESGRLVEELLARSKMKVVVDAMPRKSIFVDAQLKPAFTEFVSRVLWPIRRRSVPP